MPSDSSSDSFSGTDSSSESSSQSTSGDQTLIKHDQAGGTYVESDLIWNLATDLDIIGAPPQLPKFLDWLKKLDSEKFANIIASVQCHHKMEMVIGPDLTPSQEARTRRRNDWELYSASWVDFIGIKNVLRTVTPQQRITFFAAGLCKSDSQLYLSKEGSYVIVPSEQVQDRISETDQAVLEREIVDEYLSTVADGTSFERELNNKETLHLVLYDVVIGTQGFFKKCRRHGRKYFSPVLRGWYEMYTTNLRLMRSDPSTMKHLTYALKERIAQDLKSTKDLTLLLDDFFKDLSMMLNDPQPTSDTVYPGVGGAIKYKFNLFDMMVALTKFTKVPKGVIKSSSFSSEYLHKLEDAQFICYDKKQVDAYHIAGQSASLFNDFKLLTAKMCIIDVRQLDSKKMLVHHVSELYSRWYGVRSKSSEFHVLMDLRSFQSYAGDGYGIKSVTLVDPDAMLFLVRIIGSRKKKDGFMTKKGMSKVFKYILKTSNKRYNSLVAYILGEEPLITYQVRNKQRWYLPEVIRAELTSAEVSVAHRIDANEKFAHEDNEESAEFSDSASEEEVKPPKKKNKRDSSKKKRQSNPGKKPKRKHSKSKTTRANPDSVKNRAGGEKLVVSVDEPPDKGKSTKDTNGYQEVPCQSVAQVDGVPGSDTG